MTRAARGHAIPFTSSTAGKAGGKAGGADADGAISAAAPHMMAPDITAITIAVSRSFIVVSCRGTGSIGWREYHQRHPRILDWIVNPLPLVKYMLWRPIEKCEPIHIRVNSFSVI